MKSLHLTVIAALLLLAGGCNKETGLAGANDPHQQAEANPPSVLEQNLLDLYQTPTYGGGAMQPQAARKTVTNDIDAIPEFSKLFDNDDLAVIIGIEHYQSLPPVEFSANDAALVRDYLEKLGFAERNIRYIVNERATQSAIRVAIEKWLPNNTMSTSRLFFFYSGHGSPEPSTGDAYLVPYDGDPNYLKDTSYPLRKLYANLGNLPAQEVIVVTDACFSGIGGRSVLAKGVRSITMRPKQQAIASHMAILSATSDREIATSFPDKQHGLFTYYFLKSLYEGKKNLPEIYDYLKPLVRNEAQRQNVSQSPRLTLPERTDPGRFQLAN